jgi:hypothetical protein
MVVKLEVMWIGSSIIAGKWVRTQGLWVVVHVKQSIRNSTGVRNKISDVKLKNGTLI